MNERTGSYLEGVGDVFKGYGDAAVGTAEGLYQMARHPVNTAKNLWTLGNKAVRNPSKAFNVVKTGISEKLETNRGAGELIGSALIGVATGSAISTGTKAGLAYASSRMAGTQAAKVGVRAAGKIASPNAPGFMGRRGFELQNIPGQYARNLARTIDGRDYTRHALDQMQNRGLLPSVVEHTIKHGKKAPGNLPDRVVFKDSINKVSTVLDAETGRVITVRRGL